WFDVLTPKQAMLFLALGRTLRDQYNCEIIYTTREHDYIQDIFSHAKEKAYTFGKYGGKNLGDKLLASAKRVLDLSKFIISKQADNKQFLSISFSSPDASRVAFGLGMPILLLNDTAHSKPVGKLTFSLANYLVTPDCIDKDIFSSLGAQKEIIHQYHGVDELEYLTGKNYQSFKKLKTTFIDKVEERYIVFRPEESFASYMKEGMDELYLEILQHLLQCTDKTIRVFPRYEKQAEIISSRFKNQVEIASKGYHYLDLFSKADVVITGGGTMGREAALLGIPSITYFWRQLEPQTFIEKEGFPSFSSQSLTRTKGLISDICQNPEKYSMNTENMLESLEKPSDIIIPLLKKNNYL
ncbi:DUF354 domain-containing protein, partial [Candidatus Heimdallarchaeota archaeon]